MKAGVRIDFMIEGIRKSSKNHGEKIFQTFSKANVLYLIWFRNIMNQKLDVAVGYNKLFAN